MNLRRVRFLCEKLKLGKFLILEGGGDTSRCLLVTLGVDLIHHDDLTNFL
jgi:hypothetical protein